MALQRNWKQVDVGAQHCHRIVNWIHVYREKAGLLHRIHALDVVESGLSRTTSNFSTEYGADHAASVCKISQTTAA